MLDISSFFDNLNHQILKDNWIQILGFDNYLPKDHYNVWKNITKFSYISHKNLFNLFKEQIIVERLNDTGSDYIYIKKPVSKSKFLREKGAVAFCDTSDMNKIRKSNIIKKNKNKEKNSPLRTKGIPQGSPMSALLANIYMINFDKKINEYIKKCCSDNSYRRYSDDIVIICTPADERKILKYLKLEIEKIDLSINDKKTQIFKFLKNNKTNKYESEEKINGNYIKNRNFEYLGFSFDGETIFLKNASLSKFYRSMKRSCRYGAFHARTIKNETRGILFKSNLYKRFTIKGAKRRRKFIRNPNTGKFRHEDKYEWGNYLTYCIKAADTMSTNKISKQTKNTWKNFHNYLKKLQIKK